MESPATSNNEPEAQEDNVSDDGAIALEVHDIQLGHAAEVKQIGEKCS